MFVEVTSDFTKRDIDFEWLGVPVVTKGATASRFVFSVLQIQIRQENTVGLPNKGPLHVGTPKLLAFLLRCGQSMLTLLFLDYLRWC